MKNTLKTGEGGYVLITALIFFFAGGLVAVASISDGVLREIKTINNESLSRQGYFTSESALEDALYRVTSGKQMGTPETLTFASSTATVSVSTLFDASTRITSSAAAGQVMRSTEATVSGGNTIALNYVLQAGVGGIDLGPGISVIGDMYTSGSIRGGNASISGIAVAGEAATILVDQDNSLPTIPAQSISFGDSASTQDVAQSFRVSSSASLMGVRLYLKKVGNPTNATIKIVPNSGNRPNFWNPLASGTLSSSLVSTSYGWVDIVLTANPVLSEGTTYWIVIDGNPNASSYYVAAANSTYSDGQAKIGRGDWNSWGNTSPSGLDMYFTASTGSNSVGILGDDEWNRLSVGTAYANQVSFVNASEVIYCQSGGSNNKECDTSRADPVIEPEPILEDDIEAWKAEALAGGVVSSQSFGSSGGTIGPKKVNGNLSVSGGGQLQVSGTLWVTGNVSISGDATVSSADSSRSFVIVADGGISVSGGAQVIGSENSHLLLLSTSSANPAVSLSGGANDTAVAAPYGTVSINGGTNIRAVLAKHISIFGGAQVVYDPEMSLLNISGGTSSSGPLNIKSWKETQ